MSYNKCIIEGRLTKDPVLRHTQSGVSVCSFSVAVDRRNTKGEEKQTDFFECVAWRGLAEIVSQHFHKGKEILVDGELHSERWEDDGGVSRLSWKLQAREISFVGSKSVQEKMSDPQSVNDLPTVDDDVNPF